jgi:hypothetical protein
MFRKKIIKVFAILLLGIGWQSSAQADGFYIGGAAHAVNAEYQGADDTDSTTSLTLGYIFIDSNLLILSAELSRYDLGSFSDGGFDIDSEAVSVGAMAALPLGPFIELYGKLGVASVEVDINGQDFDGDENFYGFGLGFDFFDTVDLFVEYLEFDNEIESELVGIGLRLDF